MWCSLEQTKLTATGVIVRSQQSFLIVTVSDCCCSTFLPLFRVFFLWVFFLLFFFVSLYSTFHEFVTRRAA